VAGEFSPFEELHGFRIDGVDLETSALPEGWRDRLVKVQNANASGPGGGLPFTGWCLEYAATGWLGGPPWQLERCSRGPVRPAGAARRVLAVSGQRHP
jgi:hypothetical protein